MKILIMLAVLSSFNTKSESIEYKSNLKEQVVNFQAEQENATKENINYFIMLLNNYTLRNNIEIMTVGDYVDFFKTL